MLAKKAARDACRKGSHRAGTWIVAGGYWLWCANCGCIRPNGNDWRGWVYPTGRPHALKTLERVERKRGKQDAS